MASAAAHCAKPRYALGRPLPQKSSHFLLDTSPLGIILVSHFFFVRAPAASTHPILSLGRRSVRRQPMRLRTLSRPRARLAVKRFEGRVRIAESIGNDLGKKGGRKVDSARLTQLCQSSQVSSSSLGEYPENIRAIT